MEHISHGYEYILSGVQKYVEGGREIQEYVGGRDTRNVGLQEKIRATRKDNYSKTMV